MVELKISTELIKNARCKRCHRKLKDLEAVQLGYGKICYEKVKAKQINYLFEIKEV